MKRVYGAFDSAEVMSAINSGDTVFLIRNGVLRIFSGSYEIYFDLKSREKYELVREPNYTKGIRFSTDKYGRELRRYYINGNQRRRAQYEDVAYRYFCKRGKEG